DQASSRENVDDMAVRLAERPLAPRRARPPMEKFVIDGGVPLSGTVTPAGNKNGALPILAASVLTEEEILVRNVPRIRDVEAMLADFEHRRDIVLTAGNGRLRPGTVFMDETSVMATENALMAAARTPGQTVIGNAACEPHVQDLARMLVKMGADIRGIGSNVLTVHGRDELHGCTHDITPDHIEIGSLMALAGVTGGALRIKDTVPDDLRLSWLIFDR